MSKTAITAALASALALSPMVVAAPALAQTGNPLNSIFSCQAQGHKQAGGAALGAVLGGVLANQTSGKRNKTRNIVLGAAVGGAVGSYVGCRMQASDQQRAQATTQRALDSGQNATWSNPETGASGRVTVVSSRPYQDGYTQAGNQPTNQPANLNGVRFAPGVEPQGPYLRHRPLSVNQPGQSTRHAQSRGARDQPIAAG